MKDNNTESNRLVPTDGTFDFRQAPSFALPYLATYYSQPPTVDEIVLSKFLIAQAARLKGRSRLLEIGCGPTLHHALPLAPHVAEIHMSDYLEENLEQVRLWCRAPGQAHDWSAYTSLTLIHEGVEPTKQLIQERESLARQRITRIARCDLLQDPSPELREAYDVVSCFYCAEEVGISQLEWKRVMKRVTDHLAPAGTLLMSALAGMDSYHVRDSSGRDTLYPCAFVTRDGLAQVLAELGFSSEAIAIQACEIEHPDVGLAGTLMVAATKNPK